MNMTFEEALMELLQRTTRIETRLCSLMEHTGMEQTPSGVFVEPEVEDASSCSSSSWLGLMGSWRLWNTPLRRGGRLQLLRPGPCLKCNTCSPGAMLSCTRLTSVH